MPSIQTIVIVKFRESTGLRLQGDRFVGVAHAEELQVTLRDFPGVVPKRVFTRPDEQLRPQALVGKGVAPASPDRSLFYKFIAPSPADATRLLAKMKQLTSVENAYIEPQYGPPIARLARMAMGIPAIGATPDFSDRQTYLDPAPGGIDARYAWQISGDKPGAGVCVADVEGGWVLGHEDFQARRPSLEYGTIGKDDEWVQHGTACLGEGIASKNLGGVIGVAHGVDQVYCFSIFSEDPALADGVADAIDHAAGRLGVGDIMLIELHAVGPKGTGEGQGAYIPVEFWDANFAAIRGATDRGVVVVAAAGNGGVDLDRSVYENKFDRAQRDSGAILVGAGAPPGSYDQPDRSRLAFSNWGGRLDVQGYGSSVCTTGYGDLQTDPDEGRWYTALFNGTSSAAPMVWGAAAVLQSIAKGKRGNPLPPLEMRDLLSETGSAQQDATDAPVSQRIGPRPDLRAAIQKLLVLRSSTGRRLRRPPP